LAIGIPLAFILNSSEITTQSASTASPSNFQGPVSFFSLQFLFFLLKLQRQQQLHRLRVGCQVIIILHVQRRAFQ